MVPRLSSPVSAVTIYSHNAVWIQNEGWPAMQKNILTTNLSKVVNDLSSNNIEFAVVFVGYWSQPATINYQHTDAYYTNVINQLHAVGVKAIAWAEAYNAPMDITTANRNNIYNAVIDCMTRMPWDGYNDDIEPPFIGTHQDQIDFWNGLTPILHGLGKLNMPDVGFDWEQNTNQYLHVDYILSMFYGSRSTFEDPQAPYFWQEEFGMFNGHNTPPTSPVILGVMNYYGNTKPLAWQLSQAAKYMAQYGCPNLAGFSLWLYEYVGTSFDDWEQWNYWITRLGTNGANAPPLYALTLNTAPVSGIQLTCNGVSQYTPYSALTFGGSRTINVPSQIQGEYHSVLFGAADHTGGQEGYDVYTYASGPYELNVTRPIDSVNIYTPVSGHVKIALYSSTTYAISGWVGTNEHPYLLQSQSQPTTCVASSWNRVSFPSVTAPAGIYFISIKGDTAGIIGVSGLPVKKVGGAIYGYDQFITQSYNTAFSQTFPTVEGAMGNDAAVYVPTADISFAQYYFSQWSDGSTALTRTVAINSNITLTANYVAEPVQQEYGSITVTGIKSDQTVAFQAWIDNNSPVQVPASGYTFTGVPVGSHTVHASFNGTTYDAVANVANGATTTVPFNFDTASSPSSYTTAVIIIVLLVAVAGYVVWMKTHRYVGKKKK